MSHPRSKVLEVRSTSYHKKLYSSYNDKHTSPIMLNVPYSIEITNKLKLVDAQLPWLGPYSYGPLRNL